MGEASPRDRRVLGVRGRFARWWADPWGQMVIYLLIFAVLGFGVTAFFKWARGPERSRYVPWDSPQTPAEAGR